MRKVKVKVDKPIYIGLSILDLSKTVICEFWYDYVKPKYGQNAKLCYLDTYGFIINTKTEDFYNDIANDVEKMLIHQIIKSIDHDLKEKAKQ